MIDVDVVKALQAQTQYADEIIARLDSLGYTVIMLDVFAISFVADKTMNHIKNICNITEIPDGLKNIYIDVVCGEFLQTKYNTNQLTSDNFKIDDAIASVSMGDVSVSYDHTASTASKFAILIDALVNGRKDDLICYRKIRW